MSWHKAGVRGEQEELRARRKARKWGVEELTTSVGNLGSGPLRPLGICSVYLSIVPLKVRSLWHLIPSLLGWGLPYGTKCLYFLVAPHGCSVTHMGGKCGGGQAQWARRCAQVPELSTGGTGLPQGAQPGPVERKLGLFPHILARPGPVHVPIYGMAAGSLLRWYRHTYDTKSSGGLHSGETKKRDVLDNNR